MPETCKLSKDVWLFKPSDEDILSMSKMNLYLRNGMEITTGEIDEIVMRFCGDWEDFHEFVPLATQLKNVSAPVYVMTKDLPGDW